MSFRLVVFTASLSDHVERTIARVLREHHDCELLVMLHQPHKPARRLIRNQFRNLRRHGWRWIPYQANDIARRLRGSRKSAPSLLAQNPRVTIIPVASLNHADSVEHVAAFAPDLGLSLAAPVLKPCIFTVPRLGTINIHKGKLPDYRGMPPGFWELWNKEKSVGVTVHRVDSGLDTGDILLERSIPILPFSTVDGLRVRLDALGIAMMAEAVSQIRAGSALFKPQPTGGTTYSRPTLAQEAALNQRTQPGSLKRHVKNAVFNCYAALKPTDQNRVVVFLYHRVSDAFRDAVTIGVAQFDRQMRWLADHVQIVSLDDIIRGNLPATGPVVAVTFDDGYLDNYENAAPILLKNRIPATFFVSTGHITHNTPFEHDLRKLGRGLPNMNWDNIREMHAEGLHFGSHTVNHINLAKTDAQTVALELAASQQTLRNELNLTEVMIAYPFGKRGDITPERLAQIKQAGYVANCSAYGGVNTRTVDPWDIRRQGIDHSFDCAALRAKIAGWKSTSYV